MVISSENPSLSEKIGMMLMFGFEGSNTEDTSFRFFLQKIQDLSLGGMLILGKNIISPSSLKELMSLFTQIQRQRPFLTAIDQEGGKVQRLTPQKGFKGFPSALEISKDHDVQTMRSLIDTQVQEVCDYGFNLLFAPVVDLNLNENCPVIGALGRSYSSDPRIVIEVAEAFYHSAEQKGIFTCYKHFPGHGSSLTDSHKDWTDISTSWQPQELEPYRYLINQNTVHSIMPGHLYHREIDILHPASLSPKHINGLLRHDLGYDGVCISDDLQMKAIQAHYSLKETVIKAIEAGNDILVFARFFDSGTDLPDKVKEIILQAIQDHVISEERINQSYKRILSLFERSYTNAGIQ